MAEDMKVTFTKEEVDEYINELQSSVKNKEEVERLLNLEHLPIFVAYLRRIGVPEELLEYAGVVELTRFKMRDVLACKSYKTCNVSDKGIEFDDESNSITGKSKKAIIGMDENNVFRLDNEKYFEYAKKRKNVFLRRKTFSKSEIERGINGYGIAYLKFVDTGTYSYMESREEIDGIPYFIIESSDGMGFEHKRKTVDIGQPVYNGEFENTFAENYRMYATLFPKLKYWYEDKYGVTEENVDEYSRKIECARLRDKVEDLNRTMDMIDDHLYRSRLSYSVLTQKIDSLIDFLKNINPEFEEGKKVISDLLGYAEKVREENKDVSLEKSKDNNEKENQKDNEKNNDAEQDLNSLDVDELNLIVKSKTEKISGLREVNIELESKNYNYRKAVYEIERKITEIKKVLAEKEKKEEEISL